MKIIDTATLFVRDYEPTIDYLNTFYERHADEYAFYFERHCLNPEEKKKKARGVRARQAGQRALKAGASRSRCGRGRSGWTFLVAGTTTSARANVRRAALHCQCRSNRRTVQLCCNFFIPAGGIFPAHAEPKMCPNNARTGTFVCYTKK